MKIFISDSYESMCQKVLKDILKITNFIKKPVLCTASGDTPAGLYKQLVSSVNEKNIDVSNWLYVSLDEWIDMNGMNEGSCRFHLDEQLFKPLNVPEERLSFFDGRAKDPITECDKVEKFIQINGGIDIAIVGVGMNGHVGMNEPGTSQYLHAHVTKIDSQTQAIGQKYFKQKQQLTEGITLGLANIMEAQNIYLMASGRHKAAIVKQVLEGEITDQIPSGLLRNHPALSIYLDKEAASLLQNVNVKK